MAPNAMPLLDLPPIQKLAGQIPQAPLVGAAARVRVEDGGVDQVGVQEAEGPVCVRL